MSAHSSSPLSHPALTPFTLAGLRLRNRLAVAPMSRVSTAGDGVATPAMRDYYAGFAAGGFGLVVSEGIYTDEAHSQAYPRQPGLANAAQAAAWRPVVEAVHAAGGVLVAQLMHAGALSQGNRHRDGTIGPSALQPRGHRMPEYGGGDGPYAVPAAMSDDDIAAVAAGFAAAARRARDAGFDGVELHGANGYLLDQFLTDYTNRREDRWGGPVERRVAFAATVLAVVRDAVGGDWPVGVRLSQTKVNDFAHRWAGGARDGAVIFAALRDAGASYLHLASEGRDWLSSARLDNGVTITQLARQVTGLPVIANGGLHQPALAARVLDDGHADLLAIGRAALVNPDLPRRLAAGLPLAAFDHALLEPSASLDNAARWLAARAA